MTMKDDQPPRFHDHGIRDVTTRSWFDGWRRRTRVFTYHGACVVCRRATWDADDGENDPRGVLGDHASSAFDPADFDVDGMACADPSPVPVCFPCANDYDRYRLAVAVASARWGVHVHP